VQRYLAEFEFRYNSRQALGCDDGICAARALEGIMDKRLTYQTAGRALK
jgi:hypothetical protein